MTQMAGLAAIISIGVVAFVVAVLVFTNDRRQTSSVLTETAAVEHPVSVPAPVAAPVAVPEPVLQPEAAPVAVPEPVLQPEAVPEAVVESGAETPAETPTETPTETAAEEPTETAAETVSATAPAETAGNVLKLVATDKVKVKITVDDQPATAKDLEPGETSIEFKSSAQILVYDAGSVTVFFNGKELSPLGAKGRVRRLSFADSSQNSQTF
jgi:hypothetical protein